MYRPRRREEARQTQTNTKREREIEREREIGKKEGDFGDNPNFSITWCAFVNTFAIDT